MTRGTRFESRVLVQSDYALSEISPLALLIRCSPRVYICTCAPYAWLADAADAAAAKSAYLRTHPSTRLSHAHAIPACQLYISPNPQTVETGTSLRVDGEARTLTEGRLGLLSKTDRGTWHEWSSCQRSACSDHRRACLYRDSTRRGAMPSRPRRSFGSSSRTPPTRCRSRSSRATQSSSASNSSRERRTASVTSNGEVYGSRVSMAKAPRSR